MIRHIDEAKLYSKAVVHNGIAYLSGQLAWNKAGASFAEQTLDVFANVEAALAAAETDKSKLLAVTIYLNDIDARFGEFNELYAQWLDGIAKPSRTCIQAKPPLQQYDVELTVIAAV